MKILDVYEFEGDYEFETSTVGDGSIVIIEEIHNRDSRDVPPEITFTSLNDNKTYYMFNHDFNDYAVPTGYNLKDEEYQRIFLTEHSDLISKNMDIIKYTFSPEIIKEFEHVFLGAELGLLEKRSNFTMKKFNEFKITENIDMMKPYLITKQGLLELTYESMGEVFLTDLQYQKVKGLSESISEKCELLDKQKELEIQKLKLAISKVKKDNPRIINKGYQPTKNVAGDTPPTESGT